MMIRQIIKLCKRFTTLIIIFNYKYQGIFVTLELHAQKLPVLN